MTEVEIRADPTLTTSNGDFVSPEDWDEFHDITGKGGEGLTVAVMDSGIDTHHPIFDDVRVDQPEIDGLPTNQTDRVGHGTACAGTLLLLAPNIERIVDVPIFADEGRTGDSEIRAAYEYLIDHADELDMVNMSWGASSKYQPYDTLHNELEQAGVDAVVAAGNTDKQTGSPATSKRAYAVSACTINGRMTRWSSPTDNVTALGKNIAMPASKNGHMGRPIDSNDFTPRMEEIGGEWIKASGTSFACPGVLGMAASFRSMNTVNFKNRPDVQTAYEKAFRDNAVDITGTDEDGVGYVDYKKSVDMDKGDALSDATVWSMPWNGQDFIHIDADVLPDGNYRVNEEKLAEAFIEE